MSVVAIRVPAARRRMRNVASSEQGREHGSDQQIDETVSVEGIMMVAWAERVGKQERDDKVRQRMALSKRSQVTRREIDC